MSGCPSCSRYLRKRWNTGSPDLDTSGISGVSKKTEQETTVESHPLKYGLRCTLSAT